MVVVELERLPCCGEGEGQVFAEVGGTQGVAGLADLGFEDRETGRAGVGLSDLGAGGDGHRGPPVLGVWGNAAQPQHA
jgi:hypothetical protein